MSEAYPNITWEVESKKAWSGDKFQEGSTSMVRHVYCELQRMEKAINEGKDPIESINWAKDWLTKCLYSSNMENFKASEPEFKPFERE